MLHEWGSFQWVWFEWERRGRIDRRCPLSSLSAAQSHELCSLLPRAKIFSRIGKIAHRTNPTATQASTVSVMFSAFFFLFSFRFGRTGLNGATGGSIYYFNSMRGIR